MNKLTAVDQQYKCVVLKLRFSMDKQQLHT
jgi:hypothetical protein